MQRILTSRERTVLYLTIAVVIFGVIFNLLYEPIIGKNRNLNKEIDAAQGKLKKYLLLLSQKNYIMKKFGKYYTSANAQNVESNTEKFVDAFTEIERLAKDSGVFIADIRPQSQDKPDSYKETLINLRTEGAIEGYLKFIYNTENSPFLLRITRLQLTSKLNSQNLEGNFTISQVPLN